MPRMARSTAHAKPRRDEKANGTISVVIADDHRSFGEALQITLDREQDLSVVAVVTDGPGAIDAVEELEPDVVLMDLAMPGMDGVEATRRIHESAPETRVIVLSGSGDDSSLARSIQAGARGYLRKTEAVLNLAAAIRKAHTDAPLHDRAELEASLKSLRRRRALDGNISARLERLTPRELEILQRMTDGQSPERIAEELDMSPHTLRTHTQNVLTKLGVHSKLEAIVAAIRHGKVDPASAEATEPLEAELL